jgi:hypothetical protein
MYIADILEIFVVSIFNLTLLPSNQEDGDGKDFHCVDNTALGLT